MGPSGFDSFRLQDEHFAVMAGCSLSFAGLASVAVGQCGARGAVGALVLWCSWSPRAALIIHHSDPSWHAADQVAQCAVQFAERSYNLRSDEYNAKCKMDLHGF